MKGGEGFFSPIIKHQQITGNFFFYGMYCIFRSSCGVNRRGNGNDGLNFNLILSSKEKKIEKKLA